MTEVNKQITRCLRQLGIKNAEKFANNWEEYRQWFFLYHWALSTCNNSDNNYQIVLV